MTLIEKLEQGPGSRELSDECLLAVGWMPGNDAAKWWFNPIDRQWNHPPDPSQNLQDALDWMVPEGWDWEMDWTTDSGGENVLATCRAGDPMLLLDGEAATPPLAASIVGLRIHEFLRAREAIKDG